MIKTFFTTIAMLFVALLVGMFFSYSYADDKAEKICSLAAVGMKYTDFTDAVFKAELEERKPLEKHSENGESTYEFLFIHMMFSYNSCDIHVKDGIITKKEVILDAG